MKDFKKNGVQNQRKVLLRSVRNKAKRREQRWHSLRLWIRRTVTVTFSGLSLWGIGIGGHHLLTSPVFVVQKIVIEGNSHLTEKSLRRYEGRLAHNIFLLNLKEIRKDLLSEPYVKDVFLRRELPNRVFMQIKERTPAAVLQTGKEEFLVDQEGRILEPLGRKKVRSLPFITGIHRDKKGLWKEDLSQALLLVLTLKNYGYPDLSELQKIEVTHDRGMVLHPEAGGYEILCGSGNFLQKMILLKRVASDLADREWPVRRIDLRFRVQVVIGIGKTV
jgi:cell division protein FtsQ